jgi:hypothetical protein
LAFNVLRVPVDFAALIAAGLATYVLRTEVLAIWRPVLFSFNLPLSRYLVLVFAVSVLLVLVYAVSGLYAMRVRLTTVQEVARVFVATSAGVLAVVLFIFLRQELFDSLSSGSGAWRSCSSRSAAWRSATDSVRCWRAADGGGTGS